jgi:tRNA/tmRNA/rRNA uracil-C5-methylase (TrmA/RlmC/RlmD family)
VDFSSTLRALAIRRRLTLPPANHPEPLAALDYAEELALKQAAMLAFWQEHRLPGDPDAVVAAPVPRGYRTTTKRRAVLGPKGLAFIFPGAPSPRRSLAPSALDLPDHHAVYSFLIEQISHPRARPFASKLNWVIVRGTAGGLAVILNVRLFDAAIVRAAKKLAEALQSASLGVRAGFLYLDPTASDYYLETRRPEGLLSFKRLFGPDALEVAPSGVRLRFPPTVFSQVNGPMLGVMTESLRALITPVEGLTLLDLYCGYGLFSLTAARDAGHVTGVDFDGPAISAARANAKHLGCTDRMRFLSGRIDGAFIEERILAARDPEVILLDPPRQGTASGVIPALAARAPERIVHICCGTDEIPGEAATWARTGYRIKRAVPLDLFAGTASIETMLLLTR